MSTLLYLRNTSAEPLADGNVSFDLHPDQGASPATIPGVNTQDQAFANGRFWFYRTVGAISPESSSWPVSLNVSSIQNEVEYRFRLERRDSAGTIIAPASDWSAVYTAAAIRTETFVWSTAATWNTGDQLVLAVDYRRIPGNHGNVNVNVETQDADSVVTSQHTAGPSESTAPIPLTLSVAPVTSVPALPVANAGPDQTVTEGDTVTLDGSASSDTDEYNWTVTDAAGTDLTSGQIGTHAARIDGTLDSFVHADDSAALSVTGDIDIRIKVALDNWTDGRIDALVGKYGVGAPVGSQRSYYFRKGNTDLLQFFTSPDGVADVGATATAALSGVVNGEPTWLRVTRDVDDGAGNRVTRFYQSDDGETWTLVGDPITTAGTTSIFDGTAPVALGARDGENGAAELIGHVYQAEIRDGIDGTVVADANIEDVYQGTASFTDDAGVLWTMVSATEVVYLDGAAPSFTAPAVGAQATLTIQLEAVNANGSDTDTMLLTVDPAALSFFEEPWPGALEDPWDATRWATSLFIGNETATQTGGGQGELHHPDNLDAYIRARALHDVQTGQEWGPFQLDYDSGGNTRVAFSICGSANWRGTAAFAAITPNTGYSVEFQWDAAGIFGFPIQLVKYEAGSGTQLDTADDLGAFFSAEVLFRRTAADVVEFFIWPTGTGQPGIPTLSFDDSASPLAGGVFQVGIQRASGSGTLTFDPLIGAALAGEPSAESTAPISLTLVVAPVASAPAPPSAGPDFRSAGTQAVGTGQSLTPGLPAGHAEGDILLADVFARHDDDAFTPPDAGWTLVARQRWNLLHTHELYWKRRGATETGGAWTRTGNTTVWAITLSAWSGAVATGDPIGTVSVGGHDNAAAVTVHTGEQVVTTNPDTLIVTAYGSNDDNNVSVTSGTEAYGGTSYHTTLGTDLAQALGYRAQAVAGQSDAITFLQQQNAWDAATTISIALLGATRQTIDLGGGYTLQGVTIALTDDDTSFVRVPKPRGVGTNTFLIAVMAFASAQTQTWTGPSGWAQLGTLRLSGGAEHSSQTWTRVAGPSEPDTYVWESTDNVNHKHLALLAIDGVNDLDPVDVHTEATDAPTGGMTLAVTTTEDGALLIAAPVQESHPVDWVNDDGTMVRRYTQWQHDFNDDMLLLAVFDEVAGAAGTYTRVFSHAEDEDNSSGHLIALKPSGAAPPATATASIPLTIAVGAEAQTGHEATAAIPLTITVGAEVQAAHQATASIPLTLAVAAEAEATHEVTSSIPLSLDVADGAVAAEHRATTEIALTLAIAPVTSAPTVGLNEATASIPLALAVGGVTETEHSATAELPLTLGMAAVADAPTVGVAEATAQIPLALDVTAVAPSYVIPLATEIVDGATNYDFVVPGDTLLLEAGTRGRLRIRNLQGTLAEPITIVNDGGVVNIVGTSGQTAAIQLEQSSRHLRILGNGVSSQVGAAFTVAEQEAGIRCSGAARGISPRADEFIEHIELGYIEIFDTAGNPGVHTSNVPPATWGVQSGLHIHHMYIHDIFDSEGLYIGSSAWSGGGANDIDGIQVEWCLVEDTDLDGIQIGAAARDTVFANRCAHNVVRRAGHGVNAAGTHTKGIIVNRGTIRMDLTHNWVEESAGEGIYDQGLGGGHIIANNVVIRSGQTEAGTSGTGIRIQSGDGDTGDCHVLNNTVIDSAGWGVDPNRSFGANTIRNNICLGNTLGAIDTNAFWTASDNRATGTVGDAGFVDAGTDDYHLAAGSPCVDAGVDVSSLGVVDDFDGNSRPAGVGWDQGAFEQPVLGEVAAQIPLTLDLTGASATTYRMAAEIPLELQEAAEAQTEHAVVTGLALALDTGAVADAPTVDVAEVTAEIPLTLGVGADAQVQYQVVADLPLALDVATTTATSYAATSAIPMELGVAAISAAPILLHLTDQATWLETELKDHWAATARGSPFVDTESADRFTATARLSSLAGTTARVSWLAGTTVLSDRWTASTRSVWIFQTTFYREGETMALNFVALGPYTENEVPESLLIRWLRTHADNTTSGLPLHGQTPAFTVEAHIEKPSGATVVRACEILDPATLSTEFPDPADQTVITDGDEGWIRMPFNAGDFDELTAIPNSLYGIQLVATNGTLNLKTRDVWRPEVNVGPASAAVLA